jgi:hypothetical protein
MPAELLVFCTLLGPEGPGLESLERVGIGNGPLDPFVTPQGGAGDTARILRTTQWTRAS